MSDLGFLFSPTGQAYNAQQTMMENNLKNRGLELRNQQAEAELPGIVGMSQSRAAQGQMDQELLPQSIEAKRSELMSKMDEVQLKSLRSMGERYSQLGAVLESLPDTPAKEAQAREVMRQYGIQDNPVLSQLIREPAKLRELGKTMMQSSSEYLMKTAPATIKADSIVDATRLKTSSAERMQADKLAMQDKWKTMDIESKEKIAEEARKVKAYLQENNVKSTDQLVARLTDKYLSNPTQENKEALEQATQVKEYLSGVGRMTQAYLNNEVSGTVLPALKGAVPKPANPVANFPTVTTRPAPQVAETPEPAKNEPASAPAQGGYEVGKTYKGSTGTYKYLGGDPKSPKSWQKV